METNGKRILLLKCSFFPCLSFRWGFFFFFSSSPSQFLLSSIVASLAYSHFSEVNSKDEHNGFHLDCIVTSSDVNCNLLSSWGYERRLLPLLHWAISLCLHKYIVTEELPDIYIGDKKRVFFLLLFKIHAHTSGSIVKNFRLIIWHLQKPYVCILLIPYERIVIYGHFALFMSIRKYIS